LLAAVLLLAYLLSLLLFGFFWAYENILEPAYVSTVSSCGIKTPAQVADMGYAITARYFPKSDEVKIYTPAYTTDELYLNSPGYQKSLAHEICHRKQEEAGRLSGCRLNRLGFPMHRFIDEVECGFRSLF